MLVTIKYEGDWEDVRGTSPKPIARITQLCVRYVPYANPAARVLCRDAYTPTPGTDEERFRGDRLRGAEVRACWESVKPNDPVPECWY